ncbi:hypothetical protein SD70_12305 [Gordoniibacillus kamchatkensis]|uniref:HTH deoR-type domain-containing protein n=1 Tax=Gordoniibacillus kamchatkensis TaxID=1590651 RepID=A0ABR5AI03_9BACL|nr:YafY family protein [Paenibacillus sp. VKM B-2647]KIL40680.1 hypothetical protein SD70_12305 [Paenibacillus sp. VKM B-2647]
MRADRLLQIMLLLQTRQTISAKELAQRLEVSERTIFRDMEALSAAGVPVYAERGAQGGWRLAEGYRTDWAGFRKDELLSLLAAKPHRHLTDLGLAGHFEAALLKLLAGLTPALRRDADYMRQRLYVDAAGWHPSGEEVPWLPLLQEAVWEGRKLRLLYASGSGNEHSAGERVVHPLGLVLKGSLWYLAALPDDDRQPRTYRVSRIRWAELLEDTAERPQDFDLASYWHRSVERFRSGLPSYPVRARVQGTVRSRLEQTRFVSIAEWSERPDSGGWHEALLQFNTLESACDIALSFGARLQVLEPAELRAALRDAALAVADLYGETEPQRSAD